MAKMLKWSFELELKWEVKVSQCQETLSSADIPVAGVIVIYCDLRLYNNKNTYLTMG